MFYNGREVLSDHFQLRDAPQTNKRENVGILKKQGGGSTRIPLPFFTAGGPIAIWPMKGLTN